MATGSSGGGGGGGSSGGGPAARPASSSGTGPGASANGAGARRRGRADEGGRRRGPVRRRQEPGRLQRRQAGGAERPARAPRSEQLGRDVGRLPPRQPGKGASTADFDVKTNEVLIRRSGRVVERFEDDQAILDFAQKKRLSDLDRETLAEARRPQEHGPRRRAPMPAERSTRDRPHAKSS